MKLKKLELCGFKTFPEPTALDFHDGITAIVGPNGCGKSNVIDAIRWVMGEMSAKGLRGDSMEDVIFSGSESRKPLNLAEVTLTLTEVEGHLPEKFGSYHEVAITRRLHRSGDSEYLINKTQCRLRDITELFMDTGVGRKAYSVVEQGRIEAILAAKPRDRRFLIEEAAGITKYKSRKDETVRKMEHTAQNLQRLGDVIGEVGREMNGLKRQAARAEAFRKLRAEKRALERDAMVCSWLELAGEVGEARCALETLERGAVDSRSHAVQLGASLEEGRLRILDEERAFESRQRGVYHLQGQISEREGRTEFLQREIDGLAERAEETREEAEELAVGGQTLTTEIGELRTELQAVETRVEERVGTEESLRRAYEEVAGAQAAAEQALEDEKRASMKVLSDLTRTNHGLDHARRQASDAGRRLDELKRQETEAAFRLAELGKEVVQREADLVAAEKAQTQAGDDRTAVDNALRSARSRRQSAVAAVEEARRDLHTDQSRLRGLEQIKESLDGYGAGVKAILREAKNNGGNGVRGVVADAISAPVRYETALEAALGECLQYVIVENPDRGLDAVRHLKTRKAGRSSFAPVHLRESQGTSFPSVGEQWAHGPLLDLIQVAPEYLCLARCLLGDVYVVDSLENALDLWQRNGTRNTLVTLDGETVSPEGVISGGAGQNEGAGLLRKNREIRELRETVSRKAEESTILEAALAEVDRETGDLEGRLEAAREEVHRRDLQAVNVAKDLDQLRERRERLEERRDAVAFEREDVASRLESLGAESVALETERTRLLEAQEAAEARVETLRQGLEQARENARALNESLTRHQIEDASDRERRDGLAGRLRDLEANLENVTRRREKLLEESSRCLRDRNLRVEELQRLRTEAEALRTELGREETALSELVQRLDARRGELTDGEQEAAQARRDADAAQKRLNEGELGLRQLELQSDTLRDRFRERLTGDIEAEAESGVPEGFDPAGAQERAMKLGEKLAGFGEINLLAIEEFEDRKQRYEFLETQKRDLEESLASLKTAISRINRVSRERFAETFEKVSRTFRELYPKLFRGGEARLLLTDPEDLLETGIDIVARPPGKKAQHISLLSGGEKALTATALIFSIFLVKPSPFCILDEVDAPLDDANIGRFCEMLREMSAASQFLVVTHSKATMESTDQLYGITMADPGVSKVVSVRLTEQPEAEAA